MYGLQAKKQANKVEPMVPVSLSLSPISLTLSTPGLIPVSSLVPYCVLVSLLLTCFSHKIVEEMEEKANDSQSEDEDKMESYGEESLRSEKVPTEGSKSNEADEDSIQLGEEGTAQLN